MSRAERRVQTAALLTEARALEVTLRQHATKLEEATRRCSLDARRERKPSLQNLGMPWIA